MTDASTDPSPPEQPAAPAPESDSLHIGLLARLRAYFFAGILITAPVSITFYIAWQFIKFMDDRVAPLLPPELNPQNWGIPGFGLIMVVVSLTLIGSLTAGFAGRILVRLYDMILERMPVLRSIYSAVKQIFETMLAQKANAFREVVLIQYPRPGIWTLGFITGSTGGEVAARFGEEMVNVFVPTTPNPTSGFLLFLPRRDVEVLEMSVEDGIKMVVSTGIITPPERKRAEPEIAVSRT
ncbi:DUF502 domain-containing protein [Magnetospirillum sp. UT-4]|uniref:DUF502 domain-containing protein n=1 Tax=Magnetospirillum sp. UT-4 TaxID=2681467 RepID=UPI001381E5F2|nr:DUF502 domain-containing protein [Magnetospirillum sp. UT-4]CAA7616071.1 conserved hypothetical protein [Magnetospirillum sp. UT-4]